MIATLIALATFSLSVATVGATVRIKDDMGGLLTQYESRFQQLQQSGEDVAIEGPCFSACTTVLGMVPPDRICVTNNAVLGFHAAWHFDDFGNKVTSPEATRSMLNGYPPKIRSWLARRGGLSPRMKFLRGRELASMYPPCGRSATKAPLNILPSQAGVRTGSRASRRR